MYLSNSEQEPALVALRRDTETSVAQANKPAYTERLVICYVKW